MKHRQPIAVTCPEFFHNAILRNELESRYQHIKFNQSNNSLTKAELVNFLKTYKKAIIGNDIITDDMLSRLPDLKTIAKFGINTNTLDVNAIREHKVRLYINTHFSQRATAELAIGLMLDLLRHITPSTQELKKGQRQKKIGKQLSNRTIGIIGFGNSGQELALLLRNFGCRILAFDHNNNFAFCTAHGIYPMHLSQLLRSSDIVSIHLPLTEQTCGLLDLSHLELLRPDALLINTAHRNIVDEKSLFTLLTKKRLAGYAFDINSEESDFDNRISSLDNVICTPNIATYTEETIVSMGRATIIGLENAKVPSKRANSNSSH